MLWSTPRDSLTLSTAPLNSNSSANPLWTQLRSQTIQRFHSICRFCGGTFHKYLFGIHIDNNSDNYNLDNLDISCCSCYLLTHLNFPSHDQFILCFSLLSQLDIVRSSIDFIIHHRRVPNIHDIDPLALSLPLSLLEFSNILFSHSIDSLPSEMANYKIFFTHNFNFSFIDNYLPASSMFDPDSDSDSISCSYTSFNNLDSYPLSSSELKFLHKYFSFNNDPIFNYIDSTIKTIRASSLFTSKRPKSRLARHYHLRDPSPI